MSSDDAVMVVGKRDVMVRQLVGLVEDVEHARRRKVAAMLLLREAGESWAAIGAAMGVSRQAAAAQVSTFCDAYGYDGEVPTAATLLGRPQAERLRASLGIEPSAVTWEVRVKGVVISSHRLRGVAEDRAASIAGGHGEVWRVAGGIGERVARRRPGAGD